MGLLGVSGMNGTVTMCFCGHCPCDCVLGEDAVGSVCGPCYADRHCEPKAIGEKHAADTGECPFCHNTIDLDEARRLA